MMDSSSHPVESSVSWYVAVAAPGAAPLTVDQDPLSDFTAVSVNVVADAATANIARATIRRNIVSVAGKKKIVVVLLIIMYILHIILRPFTFEYTGDIFF